LEDYEKEILIEIERELLKEDPIVQFFEIVQFQSRSKGKGKKRKFPKRIILISPSGGKRWFLWDGESDCSLPWDEWATEVFEFSRERCLGNILRSEISNLLDNFQKI
jgi:hypothetical protein